MQLARPGRGGAWEIHGVDRRHHQASGRDDEQHHPESRGEGRGALPVGSPAAGGHHARAAHVPWIGRLVRPVVGSHDQCTRLH